MKRSRSFLRALVAALLLAPALLVAAEAAPAASHQTLLQKLNMPTIYILVACSFIILWLASDTWMKTSEKTMLPEDHLEALKNLFRHGDYAGAFTYAKTHDAPLTNVIRCGLAAAPDGKAVCEEAMVTQIIKENGAFQNKIAYLSVIGVIAPMIGLSGTVFGMIDAFSTLGQAGAADPSKLSAAIGKVLYATAGGLVVAIPAFVFYYLLRNRTTHALHLLQEQVALLFRRLPYEHLASADISGQEVYAALPNWVHPPAGSQSQAQH